MFALQNSNRHCNGRAFMGNLHGNLLLPPAMHGFEGTMDLYKLPNSGKAFKK